MRIVKNFTIIFFLIGYIQCFASNTIQVKKSDDYYMQIAIELAKNNPQAPFAALIVDNKTGKILARGLNASKVNPTFHGEMVAINNCIKKHPHVNWSNVTLYTTAEPCSMCQSAVVWANIPRVVFATSLEYLKSHGWDQIDFHASEINEKSPFYHGVIIGGVLADKANPLFASSFHKN
ncbi:cytidine/deoxycytidylate deaminase [Legionella santicrucis]|uniref:Cytidine/deoxycytidylate deaminase n=1 Tax=Legionella santicrucis TaxID=45074 RepID=A0A0W0Z3E7_9GAMM|nr:nucleoside deaminase [Legionella santicrucis]KTD63655.1 cytidine/deoxycytidylate deaminase [Legionella santicrucis]